MADSTIVLMIAVAMVGFFAGTVFTVHMNMECVGGGIGGGGDHHFMNAKVEEMAQRRVLGMLYVIVICYMLLLLLCYEILYYIRYSAVVRNIGMVLFLIMIEEVNHSQFLFHKLLINLLIIIIIIIIMTNNNDRITSCHARQMRRQ